MPLNLAHTHALNRNNPIPYADLAGLLDEISHQMLSLRSASQTVGDALLHFSSAAMTKDPDFKKLPSIFYENTCGKLWITSVALSDSVCDAVAQKIQLIKNNVYLLQNTEGSGLEDSKRSQRIHSNVVQLMALMQIYADNFMGIEPLMTEKLGSLGRKDLSWLTVYLQGTVFKIAEALAVSENTDPRSVCEEARQLAQISKNPDLNQAPKVPRPFNGDFDNEFASAIDAHFSQKPILQKKRRHLPCAQSHKFFICFSPISC